MSIYGVSKQANALLKILFEQAHLIFFRSSRNVNKIQPAKEIINEMIDEAAEMLRIGGTYLAGKGSSRL